MTELYGVVPEPFGQVATQEITGGMVLDEAPLTASATPAPQPTVVITRPRRIARGTESDEVVEDCDDHDDQPTRGRRSMPKMFSARYAA